MATQVKCVLLTGASGGIGQAIARRLDSEGVKLCLAGRRRDVLEGLASSLRCSSSVWTADLSQPGEAEALARAVETAEGGVDILINNSGVTQDKLALRMTDREWNDVIQTNLTSAFQLSREVLRSMITRKWGRILNITSVVAFSGNPGQANYVASKAGLVGLTKTLALEAARRGVTVNAIAPGFIRTPMTDALSDTLKEQILQRIPMANMGEPNDIAEGVAFLASEGARYITGQTLHINGGFGIF